MNGIEGSPLIACMGGWCPVRAACPNYHASDRAEPAERLCAAGETGIRIHRPAGTWERSPATNAHLARPNPMQVHG